MKWMLFEMSWKCDGALTGKDVHKISALIVLRGSKNLQGYTSKAWVIWKMVHRKGEINCK